MTDNWDDDDFGTFESADLNEGSAPSSATVNTSTNLPAWLLEAQAKPAISPTHQRDELSQPVKATNYEQLSLPSSVASIFDSTNTSVTSEEATGDTGHDTVPAVISAPAVTEYAFKAVFSDAASVPSVLSTEEKESVFVKKKEEKKVEEMKKESDLVVQLRGQLDSAIALKEQSEMSLNELREELNHKVEEMNEKIKRKEEDHSVMMMQLEERKSKELKLLQESSENTMREVTEQYTTLCNQVAADQKLQFEKQLLEITEKCCTMLNQQNELMTQQMTKQQSIFDEKLSSAMKQCKDDLDLLVEERIKMVEDRCSSASEAAVDGVKVQIEEEFERERNFNAKSKRDLVAELTLKHKEELRASVEEERERGDVIKRSAIEETRKSILRIAREEQQEMELTRDRHLNAIGILLTSSQEHLRHLRDDVTSNPNATNHNGN
ncbi:uncharacterized protein LOC100177343 [Ciona intestinalis]